MTIQTQTLNKWSDIETAPHDGRTVDLWLACGEGDGFRVADAFWSSAINPPRWLKRGATGAEQAVPIFHVASHWCEAQPPIPDDEHWDFDLAFPDTWPDQMLTEAHRVLTSEIDDGSDEWTVCKANIVKAIDARNIVQTETA